MKNERTHSSMPTQREMELFVQKRLDSKRMAEIKAMSEKSPLLKEALEGYAMHPVIPQFSGKAQNLIGSAQAVGGIATTVTVASPWWHLSGWILGLTVGGGSAFLIFNSNEQKQEIKKEEKAPVKQEVLSTPATENATEEATIEYPNTTVSGDFSDEPTISSNANAVETSPISAINTNGVANDNGVGGISPIVPSEDGFNLILVREYADSEHPIVLNNKYDEEHPLVGQDQILHINNFKIVDYSSFRRDKWPTIEELTKHVGANYESEEAQTWMEESNYQHSVSYMDYVEQGIFALSKKDYNESLSNFKALLGLYPDDVNGLFYSGMCLYYEGEYESARTYFEQAQRSSFRTFMEESTFYSAMTYYELGDKAIAKEKLEAIAVQRGFYAKRSREILRLME